MVRHLGIIMDGNRRWAKSKGLLVWKGHAQGVQTIKHVVEFCLERAISYVSLYTFSLENFHKRSPQENAYLFDIIIEQSKAQVDEFIKQSIKVKFIGDLSHAPVDVQQACANLQESTAAGTKLTMHILFCYGGRQEIISGIIHALKDIQAGTLVAEQLTCDTFKHYLWSGDIPDPDLIIRTGGVNRLSNFLLYQAAYSELYCTPCLWPAITKNDLSQAVEEFNQRKRNFGS